MEIAIILKKHGISFTTARSEIFSFMETEHIFSTQDIREGFPNIGRASIFGTINTFLGIGVMCHIPFSERGKVYELSHTSHHYERMKCGKCNNIMSFDSDSIYKKIFEEAKKMDSRSRNIATLYSESTKNALFPKITPQNSYE